MVTSITVNYEVAEIVIEPIHISNKGGVHYLDEFIIPYFIYIHYTTRFFYDARNLCCLSLCRCFWIIRFVYTSL